MAYGYKIGATRHGKLAVLDAAGSRERWRAVLAGGGRRAIYTEERRAEYDVIRECRQRFPMAIAVVIVASREIVQQGILRAP